MKFMTFVLLSFFVLTDLKAATLTDVEVLEIKSTEEGEELKLKDLKETPDGFFYVTLDKKDKDALAKSALVIKKLLHKDKFKLSLEISSFSSTPAGSSYKSSYVEFKGK